MSLKEEMKLDYHLIPLTDIDEEARLLSVAWCELFLPGISIEQKHKLASDFMNYARRKNNL